MNRRSGRHLPFTLVGLALVLGAGAPRDAVAQMAGALGKPLPVGTMERGTVSVRVIAGAPDKPLVGIDVKLVSPEGNQRVARTDGEGRATFTGLTPGARYLAKAAEPQQHGDEAENEATSEQFTIPADGGLRLMISTRPWEGAAGPAGGGAMGAGPGMMDPRRMSGIPRGDPAVPAGQMTIAAVRGTVVNRIPEQTIHLIGYKADGTITRMTQKTDADGRATFSDLVPGQVAYYAMTMFTRGGGEGKEPIIDRVRSEQLTLPPRVGVRLMLAGVPEDSAEGPIEDLSRIAVQSGRVGADEVLIRLTFTPQAQVPAELSLYEIPEDTNAPPRLVSTAPLQAPSPAQVTGSVGEATQDPNLATGTLAVSVVHEGQDVLPMPGAAVELMPMLGAPEVPAQTTGAEGSVQFVGLAPGSQYRVVTTVHGERILGAPLTVPSAGGLRVSATVSLQVISSADARFRGVAPGKLYFVEADFEGRPQRTPPFQTVSGRGAIVSLILHGKPLLSFHINGWQDDKYMGFSGQVSVFNTSAMPWDPGDDGILIPLPKHFLGGQVGEEMADMVKVVPDEGLLWRGPLPPGSVQFVAGFSLPVNDGRVSFDMALPYGVFQSSLVLVKTPGMLLSDLPVGVRAFERQARDGRDLYVINNINIHEGQRMLFSVAGLPQPSVLQRRVSLLVGMLVLVLLGWGVASVFTGRQQGTTGDGDTDTGRKLARRREKLLDELVALEAKKKRGEVAGEAYERTRSKLKKQLEAVYAELEGKGGSAAA